MPEVTLPNTGCWEGVDLSNQSRNELCTCGKQKQGVEWEKEVQNARWWASFVFSSAGVKRLESVSTPAEADNVSKERY